MGRAPCCDKANVKKGPWSPEEDAKLKAYIDKYGTGGNWIALPQKIGLKRCGKSCRLRWLNYLRPNIKHGGFSEEEDNIICSLYISIGSRWSVIAAQLPGRTDNDIKNYWNTKLKKKLLGRRKQSNNINYLSATQEHPKDPNGVDHNVCGPVLSNSAVERLQLHMQLQTLQNPNLSFYTNPSLWPNKLHPLQEKMIQSLKFINESIYNPNLIQHVSQLGQGHNCNFHEQDYSLLTGLKIDELESSSNGLLSSDGMEQSVQDELDDLVNNKTIGFPQQEVSIAEFDCFREMDDGAQDSLVWWSNDLESKLPASSNSWDYVVGYNLQ